MTVINLTKLAKELNRNKKLSKEGKFERIIDIAYGAVYRTNKKDGKTENEKAILLTEICEKKTYKARDLRIKETVNKILSGNYQHL